MTPVAVRESAPRWRPLVEAMSISAASAAASGALSALATKIIAAMLGPAAVAVLSTLQQIRQAAVTAGTANGQTALVQGASAFSGTARRDYVYTAAAIFCACSSAVAALLALFPGAAADWAGLPPDLAPLIRPLALAAALSSLFVFLMALLNAQRAIGKLALVQLAGPAAMAAGAWPAAHWAGVRWFPALLGFSAGATMAAACVALRTAKPWLGGRWSGSAARHFCSISGVMLATGLAGSAALITVRAGILRGQGLAVTGRFDAAWAISMTQVTLVLASLQTYYLPSLSRLREPRDRAREIRRVLSVAAPAAAGVIALLAVLKPLVLTLLYSSAFIDAAHYLRWTLLGDYLKVTSWILSVPMLASAHMRVFAASDLAAAAAFVLSAALLARWRTAAESAAIAFVVMHALHLGICAVYVRRRHAFAWSGRAAAAWLAGLALTLGASAWSWNR